MYMDRQTRLTTGIAGNRDRFKDSLGKTKKKSWSKNSTSGIILVVEFFCVLELKLKEISYNNIIFDHDL